jgi:hypothetical protein
MLSYVSACIHATLAHRHVSETLAVSASAWSAQIRPLGATWTGVPWKCGDISFVILAGRGWPPCTRFRAGQACGPAGLTSEGPSVRAIAATRFLYAALGKTRRRSLRPSGG